jgi:hypothetical protein
MGMKDEQKDNPGRMQNFIFARELAEVYLLIDHLSGRSDKRLTAAFGEGSDKSDDVTIRKICEIGWPPSGTVIEQGAQAETLLLAKDRLNAAAKPANGASIAFTVMVAGDDDPVKRSHPSQASGLSLAFREFFLRLKNFLFPSAGVSSAPATSAAIGDPAPVPPPGGGDGQSGDTGSDADVGGLLGKYPPSRMSLSRLAYPGLIRSARGFRWRYNALLLALFVCLLCTCLLSWHVSAGRAILARLDAIETARAAIQKRIADAETPPPPGSSNKSKSASKSAVLPKPYVQRYCERASRLPQPKDAPPNSKIEQFEDATQLEICDQLTENRTQYKNGREDIADWLAPWGLLKQWSYFLCGGRCLRDENVALPINAVNQQQWAATLVDLLATSVLPLCYGFLGAGAAVVRSVWNKMRDSLLTPRDLTLSLGQLALGAVIGACIGLFITPGSGGLSSTVTLTPSALSFIAGFGVEGVFVALESLIKRIFNIPEQKA